MTNREKAEAIKINQPLVLVNPNYGNMIEYGALEMAKWKDHQFKEYLEKKRDEYIDTHKEGDLLLDYASCIDRIINELF